MIFTRAARDPARNNGCGPLSKRLDAHAVTYICKVNFNVKLILYRSVWMLVPELNCFGRGPVAVMCGGFHNESVSRLTVKLSAGNDDPRP